jgi:hypothetical protein
MASGKVSNSDVESTVCKAVEQLQAEWEKKFKEYSYFALDLWIENPTLLHPETREQFNARCEAQRLELNHLHEYTVSLMSRWVEKLKFSFQQGNIHQLPLTETESKLDCLSLCLLTASGLCGLPPPSVSSSAATSPGKNSSETSQGTSEPFEQGSAH